MPLEQMEAIAERHKPNIPESKPTIFDHDGDKKLTAEMGKVYDKSTAKDDFILGKRDVPVGQDRQLQFLFETPHTSG